MQMRISSCNSCARYGRALPERGSVNPPTPSDRRVGGVARSRGDGVRFLSCHPSTVLVGTDEMPSEQAASHLESSRPSMEGPTVFSATIPIPGGSGGEPRRAGEIPADMFQSCIASRTRPSGVWVPSGLGLLLGSILGRSTKHMHWKLDPTFRGPGRVPFQVLAQHLLSQPLALQGPSLSAPVAVASPQFVESQTRRFGSSWALSSRKFVPTVDRVPCVVFFFLFATLDPPRQPVIPTQFSLHVFAIRRFPPSHARVGQQSRFPADAAPQTISPCLVRLSAITTRRRPHVALPSRPFFFLPQSAHRLLRVDIVRRTVSHSTARPLHLQRLRLRQRQRTTVNSSTKTPNPPCAAALHPHRATPAV